MIQGKWGILSTIEMYLMLLSSGNVNQTMEHLKRNQSTRSTYIPIVADDVHSSQHMHLLSLILVDGISGIISPDESLFNIYLFCFSK